MGLLAVLLAASAAVAAASAASPPPTLVSASAYAPRVTPPPVSYAHGADPSFRFVRRVGTRLYASDPARDGPPLSAFYFLGSNLWQGMSLGSPGPGGDRGRLVAALDALAAAGVTQLRVLGAAEGPDTEPWRVVPSLQPCPGVYNADVLDGFFFLLSAMGARRMRATVVLGNEWPWSGGHVQYLRWAAAANATAGATAAATGGSTGMAAAAAAAPPDPAAACAAAYASAAPPNVSDAVWRSRGHQPGGPAYPGPGQGDWGAYQQAAGGFYADGWAQRAWGAHAAFLTAAVSPYTGVAARDDPTVMAWQLANEPRAGADGAAFAAWLGNASALLKRLAPRQLVSSGMEGDTAYFSTEQGLMTSQSAPSLDYVTAHLWVQNWNEYAPGQSNASFYNSTLPWARAYIAAATAEAAALHKPLVLEEFGFPRDLGSLSPGAPTARRDEFYAAVFDSLLASAASAGALVGANFWAFAGDGRPTAARVPATQPQLCGGPQGLAPTPVLAGGGQSQWGRCFTDQGSRPETCGADTWWAPQAAWPPGTAPGRDVFTGDPPHESQGWYSVYSNDTTVAVVAAAGAKLAAASRCAAAAVATSLGVGSGPRGAGACTVAVPQPGPAAALCP